MSNMKAVEWHTLDKCHICNELVAPIVQISSIADRQCMINGKVELPDVGLDY